MAKSNGRASKWHPRKAQHQKRATRMRTIKNNHKSSNQKRQGAAKISAARHVKIKANAKKAKARTKNPKEKVAVRTGNSAPKAISRSQRHAQVQKAAGQPPKKDAKQESIAAYVEAASSVINSIEGDEVVSSYLRKNVSRRAIEAMRLLEQPKTDEEIAMQLDMKINAVRRILNIMQGYGITNYNISKNVDGWLSFAWYINVNKIGQFFDYVKSMSETSDVVKENCNDYYICDKCYSGNKLIFTFDAAYEASFKCSCNNMLSRIDRIEADKLARGPDTSPAVEAVPELDSEEYGSKQGQSLQTRKDRR